jgi:hypothetical protein
MSTSTGGPPTSPSPCLTAAAEHYVAIRPRAAITTPTVRATRLEPAGVHAAVSSAGRRRGQRCPDALIVRADTSSKAPLTIRNDRLAAIW